jgi:hypothetical protein
VSVVKGIAEIVAIVVGGIWVSTTFGLIDYRSDISVEVDFATARDSDDFCWIQFPIQMSNKGKRAVDIGAGRAELWEFQSIPKDPVTKAIQLNDEFMKAGMGGVLVAKTDIARFKRTLRGGDRVLESLIWAVPPSGTSYLLKVFVSDGTHERYAYALGTAACQHARKGEEASAPAMKPLRQPADLGPSQSDAGAEAASDD